MKKKKILILAVVLLTIFMCIACTTNDSKTTKNKSNIGNDSNYDGYNKNSGLSNGLNNNGNVLDDGLNNYGGNMNDSFGNFSNPKLGDTNKIASIKDICNSKDYVEDSSVVINDNTCYVGLDLQNNNNLSEPMKEELSNEIKRIDPSITNVEFTEDRDGLDEFVNNVGQRVNIDWNKLKDLFR